MENKRASAACPQNNILKGAWKYDIFSVLIHDIKVIINC